MIPGDFSLHASEPVVVFAFWTAAVALTLTGILLLSTLFSRLLLLLRQRRRKHVLNRWRPILMAGLYQEPSSLPPLPRRDLPEFLELWNNLYESLRGEARQSLFNIAVLGRLPAAVSRMLRKGGFRARLAAISTAGNLGMATAWDDLAAFLASESPVLSFEAARALVRIDSGRAVPLLMPHIVRRGDWLPHKVAEILREAGAEHAAASLARTFRAMPFEGEAPRRLIRYLAEISPLDAAPIIAEMLADPPDDRVLNTCLQVVSDPAELEHVRALVHYPRWHVRVQVARALERLGEHADEALLIGMLGDSQWWVRYRAARALAHLAWMDGERLRHIKGTLTDRYARDILHQVMAELELNIPAVESTHE